MTAARRSSATPAVWIVQHVPGEGPGLLGEWLQEDGIAVRTFQPSQGEPFPSSLQGCRGLLVMGGPMNVDETQRHPWLVDEQRLLALAMRSEVPVLGVCLGAQLIAQVAGARVWHGPSPEVGWLEVESTPESRSDQLFAAFPQRYTPFHWHGDTFDLPRGAVHLARSAAYPHQAFRLGELTYALQYHVEVTPAMADAWLRQDDPLLQRVDVAAIRAQTPICAAAMGILARQFYASWRILLR